MMKIRQIMISLAMTALCAGSTMGSLPPGGGTPAPVAGPTAPAATPTVAELPAQKIGYVNFEQVFASEPEAQQSLKKIEEKGRKILEDEQKARTDLEGKMASFQSTMGSLNEKARQGKQEELGNEIRILQEKFTQRRGEHDAEKQQFFSNLESRNRVIINEIGRAGGYDMILNQAAVLYVSDRAKTNDLTAKVAEGYNKAYKPKATETAGKAAGKKATPKK